MLEMPTSELERQLVMLEVLAQDLMNVENKLDVLNAHPFVLDFFSRELPEFFHQLNEEEEIVVKSIIAIGQADRVFQYPSFLQDARKRFQALLKQLQAVEKFYAEIGGVIGYHCKVLSLISREKESVSGISYHRPQGIDISQEEDSVNDAILQGIEKLAELAEIYPVGGAADRLRLHDERTGLPLPAARLIFCGRTLLEGLIADLQAREYVHYKLFSKQLVTPIAMMTSHEKDNHTQILSICEESQWFLRPKESFRFFCQPSVPAIKSNGDWCMQGALRPLFKPGGHGVIWKLARDEKVFEWFFEKRRKKALIRQINNPLAGCDHGLLAFTGIGCKEDKIFGFASCERRVKATEGINVLIEKSPNQFLITNIEYCDFKRFQIVDEPVKEGSVYSKFSSNTNILFADLQAVLDAVSLSPFPGMLVNFKKMGYRTEEGRILEEEMGRLESTMQNIADLFNASNENDLKTFLTYNERRKTISTLKREFVLGSSLLETPEGCFLDLLKNARDLLVHTCGFTVPEVNDPATFFAQGPSSIFLYHPALGPLYSIIAQKLRGGVLKNASELILEIAEIDIENLVLDGSLFIQAESLMGHVEEGILIYSEKGGKCVLKNVCVRNLGIDWEASNVFWRGEISRREIVSIVLKGNGEFYAEDVILEGSHEIVVEPETRVIAYMDKDELKLRCEPISLPSWTWNYKVDENNKIYISKAQTHLY